jgi:hypothetical protein
MHRVHCASAGEYHPHAGPRISIPVHFASVTDPQYENGLFVGLGIYDAVFADSQLVQAFELPLERHTGVGVMPEDRGQLT